MELDKSDFLVVAHKILSGIREEKNIIFHHLNMDSDQEIKELEYFVNLFNKGSIDNFIFGHEFYDDCFKGQGEKIKDKIIKNGRYSKFDLNKNLWEDCELYWRKLDYLKWHKNKYDDLHSAGEVYFLLNILDVDWVEFCKNSVFIGCYSNVKRYARSKALFRNVNEEILDNENYVAVNFFYKTIFSNDSNLLRLALIMLALDENYSISYNITKEEQVELIFGSQENLEIALDFSNPIYSFNNDLLGI